MMKYLLVLLVIVIAVGIWRNNRRQEAVERQQARPQPLPSPQTMVACANCGLHLPASDALVDSAKRLYCSADHLRRGPG